MKDMKSIRIAWEGDVPIDESSSTELRKTAKKLGSVIPIRESRRKLHEVPVNEYHNGGYKHTDALNKSVKDMVVDFCEFRPGAGSIAHSHPADQVFFVVSGKFLWNIDGEERTAEAGSLIFLPKGTVHGYKALESCTMLVISTVWMNKQVIYPNASFPEVIDNTSIDYKTGKYKIDRSTLKYNEDCASCSTLVKQIGKTQRMKR